jgi:hypothetical protein
LENKLAEEARMKQRANEGDEIPKELREELDLPR